MTQPNPTLPTYLTVTQATVSVLPETHPDHTTWSITLDYRDTVDGERRYAVMRGRTCLGADGEWDWEPVPSERDDEWRATHRFDWPTAFGLAREHAPNITVNGMTAREVAERYLPAEEPK